MYAWLTVLTLVCLDGKTKTQELWFERKPPVSEAFEAVTGMAVMERCRIVGVTRSKRALLPKVLEPAFRAGVKP